MVMLALVFIGVVWGTTNALIKRGALIAEDRQKKRASRVKVGAAAPPAKGSLGGAIDWVASFIKEWFYLFCVWEYSIPFVVNLSASLFFIRALGDSPINIAVPVTNATTFAFTAVAGAALGERVDLLKAMVGVAVIAFGIFLCLVPGFIL